VVLGGGVLAAPDAALLAQIEQRYATAAPLAVLLVVSTPPVLGAALLAWTAFAAPPVPRSASARLHRQLRTIPKPPDPPATTPAPSGPPERPTPSSPTPAAVHGGVAGGF